MKRNLMLVLVVLSTLTSPSVFPTPTIINGYKLWQACKNQSDAQDLAFCVGYMTGLQNAEAAWGVFNDVSGYKKPYCVEFQTDPDVLLLVWLKYVEENPEQLSESALATYLNAMMDAFPCDESAE